MCKLTHISVNMPLDIDLRGDGCGLKQKVRDLKRIIETEVKSARAEITVLKGGADTARGGNGNWVSEEECKAQVQQAKKELIDHFDASKTELMKFFEIQKSENEKLSQQIRQIKGDNVGLQQSLVALQRRVLDAEEDLGR